MYIYIYIWCDLESGARAHTGHRHPSSSWIAEHSARSLASFFSDAPIPHPTHSRRGRIAV